MYKIEMLDMRKVRNWILLSLTLLLSCNRDTVYTVSIQGELEGIKYGTAYLRTFGEKDSFLLASAIEKGRFVLEGVLPEKGRYTLQINRKVLYLFLDGEKIQLKGDYKQLNNSDVKGSLANELEQEFYSLLEENYQKEFRELQAIYREIIQQEDQHAADDVMSQMLKLDEKRYVLVRDFIKTHPDNIFSIFLANTEIKGSYEKGKELYALLSPSMQQTAQGREVKQQVDELAVSALWVPCPEIQAETELGELVVIDSLKGNFVVLDFWASWCGPCRQEMKNLRILHKEFAAKGVRFVSISFDDSVEKWKEACEEEQIPWMSLHDKNGWKNSKIRKAMGIQFIPFIVLLDRDGNIIAKNIRRNQLRDKLLEVTEE